MSKLISYFCKYLKLFQFIFIKGFSFLDGTEKYLKKQYPEIKNEEKSHEEYLLELFRRLFNNIIDICDKIMEAMKSKITKVAIEKAIKEMNTVLITKLRVFADENQEFKEFFHRTIEQIAKETSE